MGAWYYADLGMCVVKTTVVRIYGQQQWCYSCPSGNLTYNVHDWNLKFPGYAVPIPANCPKPVTPTAPTPNPTSGGTPSASSGSGSGGVTTSGPSSGPPSSPVTPGPAPKPPAEGCAPAASIVDHSTAASQSQFAGNGGQSHAEGFGHSDLDQMAQPLVTGMTPLPLYVSDGDKPQYTQPYKFHVEDEYGHQTVHSFHEGTGPGILCFHPPELIDYMLHGSGVNPDSRWPTNLSEVTVLLHNCERADSSTGDSSVTRLAFGNPLKGTVLPKDGVYFEHDADGSILSVRATGPVGTDIVAGHLRLDLALDVGQYSDAEIALVVDQRAGTLVWNTDDEEYQYWDGAAWTAFATGGGSGDMLAANNLSDVASKPTSQYNLINGLGSPLSSPLAGTTKLPVIEGSTAVAATFADIATTIHASPTFTGLASLNGQAKLSINTPSQITSNQTGYTGFNTGIVQRASTDASRTVNTILAPATTAGGFIIVINIGSFDLVFLNDDGATGTAADRIITGLGTNYTLPPAGTAQLMYDTTSSRWRILA